MGHKGELLQKIRKLLSTLQKERIKKSTTCYSNTKRGPNAPSYKQGEKWSIKNDAKAIVKGKKLKKLKIQKQLTYDLLMLKKVASKTTIKETKKKH